MRAGTPNTMAVAGATHGIARIQTSVSWADTVKRPVNRLTVT
jgi:hypothetical protein